MLTNDSDPQNPFRSCIATASAGSGKTYQLSRRFVALVAAGADPSRILTVTFTRKAAAEMAERILSEAANIVRNGGTSTDVDAAKKIIASSGRLQISTIDSLLYQWQRRYPNDAHEGAEAAPASLTLTSETEIDAWLELAWNRCVIQHEGRWMSDAHAQSFISTHGIHGLRRYILELNKYSGLIWTNDQASIPSLIPWSSISPSTKQILTNDQWFAAAAMDFAEILRLLGPEISERLQCALSEKSWEKLWQSRIIAKETLSISQTYLRGKKREQAEAAVARLKTMIQTRTNAERIIALDRTAEFLLGAYLDFHKVFASIKQRQGLLQFSDLLKTGYQLILHPANVGSRMMIQRSFDHLMLDEFQDTSDMQWQMFAEICSEIMAGGGINTSRSSLPGTVFVVGDAKQSIYGFRDADPRILGQARELILEAGGIQHEMRHSYRSCQQLLDWVNRCFQPYAQDFPLHETAKDDQGVNRIPSESMLGCIFPTEQESEGLKDRTLQRQWVAERTAEQIASMLADPSVQIYDKKSRSLRRLQAQDCAILYRAGTATEGIEQALRLRQINVHREESAAFLTASDVSDFLALMRLSLLPEDRLAFAQVLRSPIGGLTDDALHQILALTSENSHWAVLAHLHPSVDANLTRLMDLFRTECAAAALGEAIELSQYHLTIRQEKDHATAMQVRSRLRTLVEWVRSLEQQGSSSLWQILRALDEIASSSQAPQSSPPANAVRMMTIHKSKGLEFPCVLLVGTEESWEKTDVHWLKLQLSSRPAAIFYVGNKHEQPIGDSAFDEVQEALQENLRRESERLLYVAMTRAQSHLLVVSSQRPTQSQDSWSIGFFDRLHKALQATIDAGNQSSSQSDEARLVLRTFALAAELPEIKRNPAEGTAPNAEVLQTKAAPLPIHSPFGMKIIRPHRLGGNDERPVGPVTVETPVVAVSQHGRIVGLFLHFALQHWLKDEDLRTSTLWASFCLTRPAASAVLEMVREHATGQWEDVKLKPLWNDIKAFATLYCELPFLQGQGERLVRGSIDLVAVDPGRRVEVYDYKFSPASAESLRARYSAQVLAYGEATRKLFPEHQIRCSMIQLPSCAVIPII